MIRLGRLIRRMSVSKDGWFMEDQWQDANENWIVAHLSWSNPGRWSLELWSNPSVSGDWVDYEMEDV